MIDDGWHYGYLVENGNGWFSFDRADVNPDGTWTNNNSKVRRLPFEGYDVWYLVGGEPIEVYIENQHVVSLAGIAEPCGC